MKRILILFLPAIFGQMLVSCTSTDNTRTTTISSDGTQTIVEPLPDPFMVLAKECMGRKF